MIPRDINNPAQSRWSSRTSRVIDAVCFAVLLLVLGTVIYGLFLRAHYEHSYYGAAILAIIGALVMLIGLAQQAIAARDAATWRDMAQWQLRAARTRVETRMGRADDKIQTLDPHSAVYYEHLIEALSADMQMPVAEAMRDGR